MNSKLNQRWLIVGAIWLAALVMTSLNFSKIDAVARSRESSERLRKELVFQHRNSAKLHKVSSLYTSHFKPVASVKLGFESVRSSLHALAALLGLENVKIESRMAQALDRILELERPLAIVVEEERHETLLAWLTRQGRGAPVYEGAGLVLWSVEPDSRQVRGGSTRVVPGKASSVNR